MYKKEYANAVTDLERIISYGDKGRYVDWIAFQQFEVNVIDNVNAGNYGPYYRTVSEFYYKVKDKLRKDLIEAGILHT